MTPGFFLHLFTVQYSWIFFLFFFLWNVINSLMGKPAKMKTFCSISGKKCNLRRYYMQMKDGMFEMFLGCYVESSQVVVD